MRKIILMLYFMISFVVFAKDNYVILADSWYQKIEFRDNDDLIDEIADDIIENYMGIVIHLGNEIIFDKGGEYYYTSSKNNLKRFSDKLTLNNKKVYFWFFDSFGSTAFINFYKDYKLKIDKIKRQLEKQNLFYDGIIIDLEWINYSEEYNVDNSQKYLEILEYLREVFAEKEIMFFASLADSEVENNRRGYNLEEIRKLQIKALSMLYIKDGGFREVNGYPSSIISDSRIRDLREYFNDNQIDVAIALEKGIIVKRNFRYYFIRNFRRRDEDIELIFSNLAYIETLNKEYHKIDIYEVKQDFKLRKNDRSYENIEKGEKLYIFSVNKNILEAGDFIWEYYKIYED